MIAALHLKQWWWIAWVFGLANVGALVAVVVTVKQFRREIRRTMDISTDVVGVPGNLELRVRVTNNQTQTAVLIRHMWTQAVGDPMPADVPVNAVDANSHAYPGAPTVLGTVPLPTVPYVVVLESQGQDRFASRKMRPPQVR